MKKKYLKPDIYFESFRLSTDISAGCDYNSNYGDPNNCVVTAPDMPGITIFVEGSCSFTYPGVNDQICYDIPFGGMIIHTS